MIGLGCNAPAFMSADGQLQGAMPHYLKHHSYEYAFDQGWANARTRWWCHYPKVGAIPFTPASGLRLLTRDGRHDLKTVLAKSMIRLMDEYQLYLALLISYPNRMLNCWPMMVGCIGPESSSIGIIKDLPILMNFYRACHRGNERISAKNAPRLQQQG